MQGSFLQRLILSAVAGFALALLVQFYRHVIEAGSEAMNGEYQKKTVQKAKPTPRRF